MKTESRLLKTREVAQLIGFSATTVRCKIYPNSDCYDPSFPRPLKTGPRSFRWYESQIKAWLKTKELDAQAVVS